MAEDGHHGHFRPPAPYAAVGSKLSIFQSLRPMMPFVIGFGLSATLMVWVYKKAYDDGSFFFGFNT